MLTDQLRGHWSAWPALERRKLLKRSPAALHAADYIDEVLKGAQGSLKPYLPGLKCELRLVTEEAQAFLGGDALDPEIIAAKAVQRALESLLSPYRGEDLALAVALCSLLAYLDLIAANAKSHS